MKSLHLLVAATAALLGGCSTVRNVPIETMPPGATILVDGSEIGTSPLTHGFDLPNETKTYRVSTRLEGYVESFVNLNLIYLEARGEQNGLKLKLDLDEAYQGTTPSELANEWVEIPANPLLEEADAWNRLVHTVTTGFDYKLGSGTEQKSGYLLTEPRSEGFRQGPDTAKVTNVLVASRLSSSPVVFKVKVESKIEIRSKTDLYPRILVHKADPQKQLLEALRAALTAE